ncbi:MAG: glycosyltransferase [Patescibacteria group bacterium UBA2163]
MNKTKVLYLITKSNCGGAQRYVADLANNLSTDQFEAVVAAGHGNEPGSGWLQKEVATHGVRSIILPHVERDIKNPFKEASVFFSLAQLVMKERPQVLHVNSAKAGGVGAFIGRLFGIRTVIFTAHGWASNEDRSWLSRMIIRFFEWLTIILSHKTIMNSKATYEHVASLPFVSRKSVIIHHGITPFTRLEKEAAREALGISEEGLVVGTVAEIHHNKGIDILALAAQHIPTPIYIVGDGDDYNYIKNILRQKKINNVTLLGAIPNAKKYLEAFDIFILPSRTESLGYVLLEAGHAHLPVVATKVGGVPEIIEHKKNGLLITPNDPTALANAVETLLSDQKLRDKYSASLYKKVVEHFSLERMRDKTYSLYR